MLKLSPCSGRHVSRRVRRRARISDHKARVRAGGQGPRGMRLWSKAQHHPSQWTEGLGGEKGAERVEKGVEGCGAEVAEGGNNLALCGIGDGAAHKGRGSSIRLRARVRLRARAPERTSEAVVWLATIVNRGSEYPLNLALGS